MVKKIIFNTWSAAFFNPGGGEVQLLSTKQGLEERGCLVEFYNQWKPQKNPDIFHQFSIQHGVEYPMREYRTLGKKIALSTIFWAEYPKESEGYAYIRKIFGLADILFTNSDAESTKLSKAFDININKFHKTINAVSSAYLDTKATKNFRETFKIDGEFVLSVANIDRRKNTQALLRSCKELGKKIVLIGHVRDTEYFREFKDSYDKCIFLGPIDDIDLLKSAYQQAEIFVLPSLCETPGIAALEAASQGAKIVITQEGATQEYFEDFVTYVDPYKEESIIAGIMKRLLK